MSDKNYEDDEPAVKKPFSFTSLDPHQKKTADTDDGRKKMKGIPFPDPFGVLENITDGLLFDPLMQGVEIKSKADAARGAAQAINAPEEVQKDIAITIRKDVDEYVSHLKKAYLSAPCPGCKKLVESALVGAEVFREMERTGKTASEVKDDIENIRKRVMEELHGD